MSNYVIPNFQPQELGTRELDARFLLDTRIGNRQWILWYSAAVACATRMLSDRGETRRFIQISTILAYQELLDPSSKTRLRPIGVEDIKDLQELSKSF